jgi:hypothetical protein
VDFFTDGAAGRLALTAHSELRSAHPDGGQKNLQECMIRAEGGEFFGYGICICYLVRTR